MNAITLAPSDCSKDLPNGTMVLYPVDEVSVDRLTRSLLGLCQYKAVQMLTEGSSQLAELVTAYTGLYLAYKKKNKLGSDETETEQSL